MTKHIIPTILITGVGNVLRQDDGFGIAVINELQEQNDLPENVTILETGIAGIRLVQELFDGYDVLLMVDAVQRGGEPGQIYLLEADVPTIDHFTFDQRNEFLADMHFTNPTRAMMLAKAMNILPPQVYIVGCESAVHDDFEMGLSPQVAAAVPKAVEQITIWAKQLSHDGQIISTCNAA
ncbi:MAG: hydrogenase maturation protease [Chloroflexota bacterium]